MIKTIKLKTDKAVKITLTINGSLHFLEDYESYVSLGKESISEVIYILQEVEKTGQLPKEYETIEY